MTIFIHNVSVVPAIHRKKIFWQKIKKIFYDETGESFCFHPSQIFITKIVIYKQNISSVSLCVWQIFYDDQDRVYLKFQDS